jgi:C-terminal processing protease CtpA/Prc
VEETSSVLVHDLATTMHEHPVDRVVVDLRNNGGGEAGGYRELLRFLTAAESGRPALEVLIGRLTFSAGTSLAVLLERRASRVALLGEASGGAPNFWADPTTITLPNSGLKAEIADRYEGIGGPADHRLTVEPDVDVPFTAQDYFSGHDPVLARALKGLDA